MRNDDPRKRKRGKPIVQLPADPSRKPQVDPKHYEKVCRTGSGADGVVYESSKDGKAYAIKAQKYKKGSAGLETRYRFMNGLIILSSGYILGGINCPYVIKLKDWYQNDHSFGIIMDYYPTDLRNFYAKFWYGAMSESDASFFLAELVLALEAIHKAKITHNDVKPENILIDRNGL